jgi:hypothetical protein
MEAGVLRLLITIVNYSRKIFNEQVAQAVVAQMSFPPEVQGPML